MQLRSIVFGSNDEAMTINTAILAMQRGEEASSHMKARSKHFAAS